MVKEIISKTIELSKDSLDRDIFVPIFYSLGKKKYYYEGGKRIEFHTLEQAINFNDTHKQVINENK